MMATREESRVHHQILNRVGGVEKSLSAVQAIQTAQGAAQRPISMLHGIPPPYFYGDEGEDVEAFIYALVNCANANSWKDCKTVNNLAHFLDGRAGYAFRAAVEHRVERAKGSQKERLEERRKARDDLKALESEKEQAAVEVRQLAERMADLKAVKEEEDDESKSGDTEAEMSEEMKTMDKAYRAAMELYAVASVNYATARKAAKTEEWSTAPELPTTDLADESDHSIAFPTLASALKWLRTTFRREDVEDKLTGEYFGRRQGKFEKVQDYALELLKLCSRAGIAATEAKKTKHFVNGLRPRLKKTLQHYILTGRVKLSEGSWEETIKEASKLEREHPLLDLDYHDYPAHAPVNVMEAAPTQVSAAVATPPTFVWSELTASVAALTEAAKRIDGPGKDRDNKNRSLRCYNCHELGHMAWECPQADSPETQAYRRANPKPTQFQPVCYACNEPGHYANKCPNRANNGAGTAPAQAQQRRGGERRESSAANGQQRKRMQGNGPRA